jgi:hypothetical protein
MSMGSVGWALNAARQPKLAAQREETLLHLGRLPDMGLQERLNLAESLTADRRDRASVRRTLEMLALLAREALLGDVVAHEEVAVGCAEAPSGVALGGVPLGSVRAGPFSTPVKRLGLRQAHAHIHDIRLAMERIDSNVDPRLTLEALFLGLAVP